MSEYNHVFYSHRGNAARSGRGLARQPAWQSISRRALAPGLHSSELSGADAFELCSRIPFRKLLLHITASSPHRDDAYLSCMYYVVWLTQSTLWNRGYQPSPDLGPHSSSRLAGRTVINWDNLLKRQGNLLKIFPLLIWPTTAKQIHTYLVNDFLQKNQSLLLLE